MFLGMAGSIVTSKGADWVDNNWGNLVLTTKYTFSNSGKSVSLGSNGANVVNDFRETFNKVKAESILDVDEIKQIEKVTEGEAETKFKYKNNPMDNPKAAKDIIENPDAVYGFSPNPESGRIGKFAEYDWANEEIVANAKEARLQYHKDNESIYKVVEKMKSEGATIEDMARVANEQRNRNRLQSYIDRGNMSGYEKAVESNIKNFKNELGMTAEQAYEKYGSWEIVLEKAMSANAGMDACCGLYDDFYYLYSGGDN